jgi:hypothetical protein
MKMKKFFVMVTIPSHAMRDQLGPNHEWPVRFGFASHEEMEAYRSRFPPKPNHSYAVVEVPQSKRAFAGALADLLRAELRARGL